MVVLRKRYEDANLHFQKIQSAEVNGWPDHQWHGDIDNCDVCSRPMHSEQFMIDGPAESGSSPRWGNICVVCAHKYSPAIGWGKAQLYERDRGDVWRLISGGPPKYDLE